MIRLIKTRTDYGEALERLNSLMAAAPAPNSSESDELELLSILISDYEERNAAPSRLSPIEAIKFRIEQLDMKPRDLIPYIGSRARVSEVLSGKRPLTIGMIRSLHRGLGIPAASLLGDRDPSVIEEQDIPWDRFPVREMFARGWIRSHEAFSSARISAEGAEDILSGFFAPLGGPSALAALYRKGEHVRSARTMDPYALTAWTARVLLVAAELESLRPFKAEAFTAARIRELVQLSEAADGPVRAIAFLRELGIPVVVEPHLPRTQLDGAAIRATSGRPVIGLTLRYDRLDNFWFTLMHEVAHVLYHLAEPNRASTPDVRTVERFYDDLDVELDANPAEREADALAGEWLVPSEAWESSAARYVKSPEAVSLLADELDVHPAIVAGKVRHFFKEYRVLNNLVGHGGVRRLFPALQWGA